MGYLPTVNRSSQVGSLSYASRWIGFGFVPAQLLVNLRGAEPINRHQAICHLLELRPIGLSLDEFVFSSRQFLFSFLLGPAPRLLPLLGREKGA